MVEGSARRVGRFEGALAKVASKAGLAAGAVGALVGVAGAGASEVTKLDNQIRAYEKFGLVATESFDLAKAVTKESGQTTDEFAELIRDLTVRIGEAKAEGGDMAEKFATISKGSKGNPSGGKDSSELE